MNGLGLPPCRIPCPQAPCPISWQAPQRHELVINGKFKRRYPIALRNPAHQQRLPQFFKPLVQRGKNGWAIPTFWSLIAGGLLIGLLGVVFEPSHALGRITATDLLLVAYLGIFSSGVTFWLLQQGTEILTPGKVTVYTHLIPFVSMLVLFVNAPGAIGWHWLPGSVVVILAILLLLRRSTRQPQPAPTSRTAIDPSARTGV
ncbi:EamA family transporter [uncultured Nitratireductor sp.]|uniref:EamA family transporter n=1 Tax=uncultured Nitratireductor sp. TaxID=520953 RepID=UPI0026014BF6|nr:EamA family transporter [uncultured Nitratireductor sp.]